MAEGLGGGPHEPVSGAPLQRSGCGTGLADASDQHDRAVPGRRGHRHARPLPCRADASDSGSADRHRECRRCGRLDRRRPRGAYSLQFDLFADLEPVILIGAEPLLIIGRKNFPADDLKGLIAYLKANPDGASVGIAGVGATGHLTGIALQKETGTKFTFVPYRGNGPAMQDLLSGQIDFMIEPSSNFRSMLAAGSAKPFAVTGKTRLKSSPNIPTVEEAGLPGFSVSLWYGLWVPKNTPKEIIARLNATMVQVLASAPVKQRFDDLGIETTPLA
ncbi:MAG: hypothetical protein DI543_06565, partial [Bradyrhizobium icense]